MQKYYFHIATNDKIFADEEGIELPDLARAHDHAVRLIWQTIQYDPDESDWRGWRVEVADDQSGGALTVLFPAHFVREAHFGRRRRFSYLSPFLISIALLGQAVSHASAGSNVSCIYVGDAFTCTYGAGNGARAGIVYVDPPRGRPDNDEATVRERSWRARCHPRLHRDRYGVRRYSYAKAGCEFGEPVN